MVRYLKADDGSAIAVVGCEEEASLVELFAPSQTRVEMAVQNVLALADGQSLKSAVEQYLQAVRH